MQVHACCEQRCPLVAVNERTPSDYGLHDARGLRLCVSKRCGSEVALAWSLRDRVDEAAVSDPGIDAERSLNELVDIDKVLVG